MRKHQLISELTVTGMDSKEYSMIIFTKSSWNQKREKGVANYNQDN